MKKQLNNQKTGYFYGGLAALTFAFYALINRYVYTNYEVSAFDYTATFMVCGALFAGLSLLYEILFKRLAPTRTKHLPRAIINGILAGIGLGIFVYGQNYTTAANASILAATTTIATIVFSHYILHDDLSKRQILWAIVMFTGLYVAIIGLHQYSLNRGDLFILGACVILGFTNTFSKTLMGKMSSSRVADIRLLTGGILFMALGIIVAGKGFLFTGAGPWPLLAGFFFWTTIRLFYASVGLINPNKAIVLANSHAIVTPVLGLILLSEPYGWTKLLGTLLVIISIYFITKDHSMKLKHRKSKGI